VSDVVKVAVVPVLVKLPSRVSAANALCGHNNHSEISVRANLFMRYIPC
jgi:hypothetical protein